MESESAACGNILPTSNQLRIVVVCTRSALLILFFPLSVRVASCRNEARSIWLVGSSWQRRRQRKKTTRASWHSECCVHKYVIISGLCLAMCTLYILDNATSTIGFYCCKSLCIWNLGLVINRGCNYYSEKHILLYSSCNVMIVWMWYGAPVIVGCWWFVEHCVESQLTVCLVIHTVPVYTKCM